MFEMRLSVFALVPHAHLGASAPPVFRAALPVQIV